MDNQIESSKTKKKIASFRNRVCVSELHAWNFLSRKYGAIGKGEHSISVINFSGKSKINFEKRRFKRFFQIG